MFKNVYLEMFSRTFSCNPVCGFKIVRFVVYQANNPINPENKDIKKAYSGPGIKPYKLGV